MNATTPTPAVTTDWLRPESLGDVIYCINGTRRAGWGTYAYQTVTLYSRDESGALAHAAEALKGWERTVMRLTCTKAPIGRDGWGVPTGFEQEAEIIAQWKVVRRDGKPVVVKVV